MKQTNIQVGDHVMFSYPHDTLDNYVLRSIRVVDISPGYGIHSEDFFYFFEYMENLSVNPYVGLAPGGVL